MDDSLKTIVGLSPGVLLGNGDIEMAPGSHPTVMGQSIVNFGKYYCQKRVMAFGSNNDNIRSVDATLLKYTLRSIEWSIQLMPKEDVCYGFQLQDIAWTAHDMAWKISMVAHDPRAICGQFVWDTRATLFDQLLIHCAFKISLHKDEDGNYSMLEKGEYHNVRKYLKDRFIVPTEGYVLPRQIFHVESSRVGQKDIFQNRAALYAMVMSEPNLVDLMNDRSRQFSGGWNPEDPVNNRNRMGGSSGEGCAQLHGHSTPGHSTR